MPNYPGLRYTPLLLAASIVLSGCNDTAYPTAPKYEEPAGPYYTVSGRVSDSLTGEGIPGARVYAGKRTALADAAGNWWIDVPDGEVSISSSPPNYDGGHEVVTVHSPITFNLSLRRRAPFVFDCYREGTMARALMIDLQGRKSIERWTQSEATIVAPSGNQTIGAVNWTYFVPPDYYQWPIGFAIPADATRINWEVYDNEGYRFIGTCEFALTPN